MVSSRRGVYLTGRRRWINIAVLAVSSALLIRASWRITQPLNSSLHPYDSRLNDEGHARPLVLPPAYMGSFPEGVPGHFVSPPQFSPTAVEIVPTLGPELSQRSNSPQNDSHKTYLDSNGNIVADDDVWGIGFRVSYYIILISNLLASFFCPHLMRDFRISTNLLTVAVLVNTYYNASLGSLILFEWYIVSWMTVALSILTMPVNGDEFDRGLGSLGSSWMIYGGWMISQISLYTAGQNVGNSERVPVYVLFFWKKVNIFSKYWAIFGTIMSVISIVLGIIVTAAGMILVVQGALQLPIPLPAQRTKRHIPLSVFDFIWRLFHGPQYQQILSYVVRIGLAFMLILGGSCIEGTLWINKISLTTPIIKSGQFIALIVGIGTFVMTLCSTLKHFLLPVQPPQDEPPQDELPQDEPPQDEPPQDEPPQDEPPQDEPPQDEPLQIQRPQPAQVLHTLYLPQRPPLLRLSQRRNMALLLQQHYVANLLQQARPVLRLQQPRLAHLAHPGQQIQPEPPDQEQEDHPSQAPTAQLHQRSRWASATYRLANFSIETEEIEHGVHGIWKWDWFQGLKRYKIPHDNRFTALVFSQLEASKLKFLARKGKILPRWEPKKIRKRKSSQKNRKTKGFLPEEKMELICGDNILSSKDQYHIFGSQI